MRKATGMMMIVTLICFVLGTAGNALAAPPAEDPENPAHENRTEGVAMACEDADQDAHDNADENSVFGSCPEEEEESTTTSSTDDTTTTVDCSSPDAMILPECS